LTTTVAPTPTSTSYHEPQQTEKLETIVGALILVAVLGAALAF